MSGLLHFLDQRRLIDRNGIAVGGSMYFYVSGTNVFAPIYYDEALTNPMPNPVVVDAGASVPQIYLDSNYTYRRYIVYPDGSVDDVDPIVEVFDTIAADALIASKIVDSLGTDPFVAPSQRAVEVAIDNLQDQISTFNGSITSGVQGFSTWTALSAAFQPWLSATNYVKNDTAQDQGSWWLSLGTSTNQAPPTLPTTANAYWSLLDETPQGNLAQVPISDTGFHTDPIIGDAGFTGSISGTTLTVTGTVTNTIVPGMIIQGTGVTVGTYIVSGSGTAWVVSTSQTVASTTMVGKTKNTGVFKWAETADTVPLRGWQRIYDTDAALAQPWAVLAEAWAESSTNPDPTDLSSKSAKSWAESVEADSTYFKGSLDKLQTEVRAGRPSAPVNTGMGSPAGIYVLKNAPAIPTGFVGFVEEFGIYSLSGLPQNIRLGCWTQSGNNFTEQRSVTVSAAANSLTVKTSTDFALTINGGEQIGIVTPTTGSVAYTAGVEDNGGWYYASGSGTTFTDTTPTLGVPLEWYVKIRYISVSEARLAATESGVSVAQAYESKLDASFATQQVVTVANSQTGSFDGTAVPSFRWTFGLDSGTQFPAGSLSGRQLKLNLQPSASSSTFVLSAFLRQTASGGINNIPTSADTIVWTTSVSVASTGIVSGSFGDVAFDLTGLTVPTGYSVFFSPYALASDGTTFTNIGIGRGGAQGTQRASGWYASTAGSASGAIANQAISLAASISWTVTQGQFIAGSSPSVAKVDLLGAAYPMIALSGLAANVSGVIHKDGADIPISGSVTFPAASTGKERVDLLVANALTGAVTRVAGSERTASLDALEWQGAAPAQSFVLYRVRVSDSSATTVKTATAADFRGLVKVGREGEYAAHVERNRRILRPILGRAMRGQTINLGGYGDSLVAFQDSSIAPAAPSKYNANGVWRDLRDYYFTSYPTDTKNLIPLYDFGDGAGQVHMKMGDLWAIKGALDSLAGSSVTNYLNYGIGGTTSANSADNGLWPARIAVPLAANLHMLWIAFGMNERGATTTYANMLSIVQQFQALGTPPVIVIRGVNRPNAHDSVSAWTYTNDVLEELSYDTGCAFVSTDMLGADRNLGGIGVPAECLCSTNILTGGYNHAGIWEHGRYGQSAVQQLGL